jgi:hypothetical protein
MDVRQRILHLVKGFSLGDMLLRWLNDLLLILLLKRSLLRQFRVDSLLKQFQAWIEHLILMDYILPTFFPQDLSLDNRLKDS